MRKKLLPFSVMLVMCFLLISGSQTAETPQEVIQDRIYQFKMIKIPAGTLKIGSSFANHAMDIHIKSFYLGKFEVTQKLWKAVMGSYPVPFKFEDHPLETASEFEDSLPRIKEIASHTGFLGGNLPVETVSWEDIQKFLKKISEKTGHHYRLPTEAEWIYAYRAGTTTDYYFGNDKKRLKEYEWYDKNSNKRTHPVGQKKPNPWGLYDMGGNVGEWTSDLSDMEPYRKKYPNRKWSKGLRRVYRGSHYLHRDVAASAHWSHSYKQVYPHHCVGFRLVRDLNSESPEKSESKSAVLKGPYLGQTPPGDTPELFAPGIVADIYREHKSPVFTPDGKEVFWTRSMNLGAAFRQDITLYMKEEKGGWAVPKLAPFCKGSYCHINSISPDGKRLHFSGWFPADGEKEKFRFLYMTMERTQTGWGEPVVNKMLPNWKEDLALFQETKSGNLYFNADMKDPDSKYKFGFHRAKMIDQKYQEPEPLGETINTKHLDYAFCVDPDEHFIIFASRRPGGYGKTDLYISYHLEDDSWGPAINLGPKINTTDAILNAWPSLSPDGKYLFFIRAVNPYGKINKDNFTYAKMKEISLSFENGHGKIYWVSTAFVEKLNPKNNKEKIDD